MSLPLALHIVWANLCYSMYPAKGLSRDEEAFIKQLKTWNAANRAARQPVGRMPFGASWVDSDGVTWRKDRFGTQQHGAA